MKFRTRVTAVFLSALLGPLASFTAAAQTFPERAITLAVGYPAGGGMDAVARAVGHQLSQQLGTTVVVDNKPGATGTIAAETVARARADGHVLLLAETGLIMGQALKPRPQVDPARAFTPVGMVAELPLVIVVHPSFPARTLDEFLSEARSRPGKYNYGSAGNGTAHHFAFELLKRESGIHVVHVPYRGGTAMVTDLVSGGVQIGVLSAAAAKPLIDSGRVRPIASLTAEPLSTFPNLPAVGSRLKGFDATPRLFLLAPLGTPADVVARLDKALQIVLGDPQLVKQLEPQGAVVSYAHANQLTRYIAIETPKWAGVAKAMSIRAD